MEESSGRWQGTVEVRAVRGAAEIGIVGRLFREYADSLGIDLSFQNFEAELADMPGPYQRPGGDLLIAWREGSAVGCLGIRPLPEPRCCEFKRLYVRSEGRGFSIGKA